MFSGQYINYKMGHKKHDSKLNKYLILWNREWSNTTVTLSFVSHSQTHIMGALVFEAKISFVKQQQKFLFIAHFVGWVMAILDPKIQVSEMLLRLGFS